MLCTVEQFNELVDHGARIEDSCALHYAAITACFPDNTQLMARLLELGADVNEPDVKLALQNPGRIGPPIFWAIQGDHIENVKFLVENGADLTIKEQWFGITPIETARKYGRTKIIEYLEMVSH